MQINQVKFNQVVSEAKAKAANNPRWLAAIEKAAEGILSGAWIVTELHDGLMITTENGTYLANGVCQCKAFQFGQACKHRAAARLIEMYNEVAEATSPADDTRNTCVICGHSWIANYTSDYCPIHATADPDRWRPPAPPCPITALAAERATLIAEIEAIWPRVEPHLPLRTELMARFGKSNLNMLDTDMLRRVRLAISM